MKRIGFWSIALIAMLAVLFLRQLRWHVRPWA